MRPYVARPALVLCLLSFIVSCGGGSGSAPVTPPTANMPADNGNTSVSVTSTGVITGFGSVFVNGVEYNTAAARIDTDEAQNVGESRLGVGMLVTVHGMMNSDGRTGQADSIHYGNYLTGPVDTVDPGAGTFLMMGYTIHVDDITVMDGTTLDALTSGEVVEVSGPTDDAMAMYATRVSLDAGASMFKTFGAVNGLDTSLMTFSVGSQVVDYRAAGQLPNATLADGMQVAITGTFDGAGRLMADRVQSRDNQLTPGEHMIIDGVVGNVDSPSRFQIGAAWCEVGGGTTYAAGMTTRDIAPGAHLRLDGVVDNQGNLIVDHASLHAGSNITIRGVISQMGSGMSSFTVDGVKIAADSDTLYLDHHMQMRQFGFANLAVGDIVSIQGTRLQDGTCIALAIEREAPTTDASIAFGGKVTAIDATALTFTIYDKQIQLNDATSIHYYHGATMSVGDFMSLLKVGDSVVVTGTESANVITATDVAFGSGMMGM